MTLIVVIINDIRRANFAVGTHDIEVVADTTREIHPIRVARVTDVRRANFAVGTAHIEDVVAFKTSPSEVTL